MFALRFCVASHSWADQNFRMGVTVTRAQLHTAALVGKRRDTSRGLRTSELRLWHNVSFGRMLGLRLRYVQIMCLASRRRRGRWQTHVVRAITGRRPISRGLRASNGLGASDALAVLRRVARVRRLRYAPDGAACAVASRRACLVVGLVGGHTAHLRRRRIAAIPLAIRPELRHLVRVLRRVILASTAPNRPTTRRSICSARPTALRQLAGSGRRSGLARGRQTKQALLLVLLIPLARRPAILLIPRTRRPATIVRAAAHRAARPIRLDLRPCRRSSERRPFLLLHALEGIALHLAVLGARHRPRLRAAKLASHATRVIHTNRMAAARAWVRLGHARSLARIRRRRLRAAAHRASRRLRATAALWALGGLRL